MPPGGLPPLQLFRLNSRVGGLATVLEPGGSVKRPGGGGQCDATAVEAADDNGLPTSKGDMLGGGGRAGGGVPAILAAGGR